MPIVSICPLLHQLDAAFPDATDVRLYNGGHYLRFNSPRLGGRKVSIHVRLESGWVDTLGRIDGYYYVWIQVSSPSDCCPGSRSSPVQKIAAASHITPEWVAQHSKYRYE